MISLSEATKYDPTIFDTVTKYRADNRSGTVPDDDWGASHHMAKHKETLESETAQRGRLDAHFTPYFHSPEVAKSYLYKPDWNGSSGKAVGTNPLYSYTQASRGVNTGLLSLHYGEAKSMMPQYADLHHALTTALQHAPAMPEHVVAISGVNPEHAKNIMRQKENGLVHFPAYTSASVTHVGGIKWGADSFAGRAIKDEAGNKISFDPMNTMHNQHVVVMHVPPGSRGPVYAGVNSAYTHEHEMIMPSDMVAVYHGTDKIRHTAPNKHRDGGLVHAHLTVHHMSYVQPEWASRIQRPYTPNSEHDPSTIVAAPFPKF